MNYPLQLARVIYGRKDTPEKDREYKIVGVFNCPVGTLDDWEQYARKNHYDGLVWTDHTIDDGAVSYERDFEFVDTHKQCQCGGWMELITVDDDASGWKCPVCEVEEGI